MTIRNLDLFNRAGQIDGRELERLARRVEAQDRLATVGGLTFLQTSAGTVLNGPPPASAGAPTVTAQYLNSTNFATFGPVVHFGGNPGTSDLGLVSSIGSLPGFNFPLTAGTNVILSSLVLGSFAPGNLQWDLFMGVFLPPFNSLSSVVGAQVIYHRWPRSAPNTLTTAPVTYVGVVTGGAAGQWYPVFWMQQSDDYTDTAPDTVTVQVYPQSWAVLSF